MEIKRGARDPKDVADNKVVAALGYLGILCLIPLLVKKDSQYAQFHGKQGLVLFIAEVIISFINVIPVLGQLIWFFAVVGFIMVSVIGVLKTLKGEWWKIPVLYDYSKKINI
jgi:fumarate reductase subunit D